MSVEVSKYIRLFTNYFTHRKTLRLRTLLGNDAGYWLPIRLWCYAAENQSNGDFSQYAPDEIASVLGWPDNPVVLVEKLKQAGFMDENMKLHDWQFYNGMHELFADRARKGGLALQEKLRSERENKGKERKGDASVSLATSLLLADSYKLLNTQQFRDAWQSWTTHRSEIKKPLTPTSVRAQFRRFSEMGHDRAVKMLFHTVANGWQGLYEPETHGAKKWQQPTPTHKQPIPKEAPVTAEELKARAIMAKQMHDLAAGIAEAKKP